MAHFFENSKKPEKPRVTPALEGGSQPGECVTAHLQGWAAPRQRAQQVPRAQSCNITTAVRVK